MSAPCSSTAAVRAGIDCDSAHGAVMPPIYLSSNYSLPVLARNGNTTTHAAAIRRAIAWLALWLNSKGERVAW